MEKKIKLLAILMVTIVLAASIVGVIILSGAAKGKTYTNVSSVRLQVFGNANEDDTIDQRDIDFISEVIAGDRSASNLTDANQDGVIDQKDIDQVEAIIDHEETRLYYVDIDGYNASVHYPVQTMIAIYTKYVEVVRVLNATDMIIGVDDSVGTYKTFFPTLTSLPSVGNRFTPDVEKILAIDPDIYFTGTRNNYDSALETKLSANGTDIDVVRLPTWEYGKTTQGLLTLAYILGKEERAYEYLEWHDSLLKSITDKIATIPTEDRVTVLLDSVGNKARSTGSGDYENSQIAGAINIGGELSGGIYPVYDVEWVIEKNPDFIIGLITAGYNGNLTDLQARYDVLAAQFNATDAVKNGNLHIMAFDIMNGASYLVSIAYQAKWYYPDLFADLDPQKIHQEYLDTFCGGIDLDVSTLGGFVL
ncbi:MAG: Periplasmic binding protein [Methanomassiliicoccales archaeon PtaU1.Bin030]|nr:MAG: Periplasmic binding protein [Methanomassiliicoccales archaeon PtaU1.Bin030]